MSDALTGKWEYIHDFDPKFKQQLGGKQNIYIETQPHYKILLQFSDPTDFGRFCLMVECWLKVFAVRGDG